VNGHKRHTAETGFVAVAGGRWNHEPEPGGRSGTTHEPAGLGRAVVGAQFDADDRARRGGRSAQPAAATAAAAVQRCQNDGQTTTEVGADVMIDERVDARVAVGQHVAGDTEHGIPASVRP